MTTKTPMAIRPLDLQNICDICHQRRNQGNHARCSQRRQELNRREAK
ncbi:hypothetical protein [Halopseudomonas phragmitis]|nr:hypothetical protein [Halopseudomonas phragmitis]